MEDNLKGQLINTYLTHQFEEIQDAGGVDGNSIDKHNNNTINAVELPDNKILEEFKNQVRIWIDIDNSVRKLQKAIKERNVVKKQLSEKILGFMSKYNIEDLNTRDGSKLRYKVSQVKPTITKAQIKERLLENFGKAQNVEELANMVFSNENLPKMEKKYLKRLNAPTNLQI